MKHLYAHQNTGRRRWTTAAIALASAGLILISQGLHAHDLAPPAVPTEITVPAGHTPYLRGYAIGTQNYMCLPKGSGVGWKPVGPQATLFDDDMRQIITYFPSPNPHEASPNPFEAGIPRVPGSTPRTPAWSGPSCLWPPWMPTSWLQGPSPGSYSQ